MNVAVDLQVAERQVLEVVKGAEAGAEVVERDRAAERVHAGAEGPRARHVGDRGGLGHLDHEARGVDAVALERTRDVREHVAVGDATARRGSSRSTIGARRGRLPAERATLSSTIRSISRIRP